MIAPNGDCVCIFDVALADRPCEDQSGRPARFALEMHIVCVPSDALVPKACDRPRKCAYELLLSQSVVLALHVDVCSLLLLLQRGLVIRRCVLSDLL